ncbi:hypothetical protein AMTR_s00011p00253850 [Amborella trichopoda]|uniref:GATA-type domain-containing protein n=2 Tax=Amborella trichopoda TaxID=13333 RepID=W1NHU7_AMBTC|nr:hypothetical protein AMTR_s00011p00253850 [Amborella trichopoda]
MHRASSLEEGCSSVDCTLSLGPPSARQRGASSSSDLGSRPGCGQSSPTGATRFWWDIDLQLMHRQQQHQARQQQRRSSGLSVGGDPLMARRCANCDTTSTPLWRNGPRGPKSLCNACGIRYKKEERRSTTAEHYNEQQQQQHVVGHLFNPHHLSPRSPSFPLAVEDEEDEEREKAEMVGGAPCVSWRLGLSTDFSVVHHLT